MGDEADSPIIVPRPGQILRRAARTRKAGTVDGPHRFTSNRARRASTARSKSDHRTSSDRSSSEHGDHEASKRQSADSDIPEVPPLPRPDSYSEETSIYDAYASPDLDEADSVVAQIEPDLLTDFLPQVFSHPETEQQDYMPIQTPVPPVLHHPQPKRALSPPASDIVAAPFRRSPSPETASASVSPPPVPPLPTRRPSLHEGPSYQSSTSPSPEQRREKDKDKKGLFGKWGGDKGGKKSHKEKEKGGDKEKDPGFFGSLFGTKKKQEESSAPPIGLGGSGRETAAALLGASKSSKSRAPSPSPTPVNGYSRYPIHVERAIYRLSHIKLANPRRPLYEQVLISNLMFWYLGVINNKATSPSSTPTGPQSPANPVAPNGSPAEKEQQAQAERDRKEREEQEKAERERQERERERQQAEQKKESRRGSLTKNNGPSGARRAEMPVRGPQYDMQHRAIEQEYGGFTQASQPRSPSAPPTAGGYTHPHQARTPSGQHGAQQSNAYSSVQLVQPQPQQAQRYYNGTANPQQGQSYPMNYSTPSLPPGAMPPVNVEQGGWMAQPVAQQQGMLLPHTSPSPPPRTMSPPLNSPNSANPRRARSPPVQPRYTPAQEKQPPQPYSGGGRLPGRSLSATAVAPPTPPLPQQANGKVRKGQSAHAVVTPHQRRTSEEEDLPLAYYQQQRRK